MEIFQRGIPTGIFEPAKQEVEDVKRRLDWLEVGHGCVWSDHVSLLFDFLWNYHLSASGGGKGGNCDSFQLFLGLWVGEGGAGCFLSVLFFRMPPGLECVPPLLLHAGGSGGQFFNWSILVSEGKRIIVSDLFGRLFVVFETLTSRVNVIQHSHRRIGMAKEARQRLQLGS